MARQEGLKELEAHSVFLVGFKHPVTEEQINQILSPFGHIERVILDKRAGKFVIVEFSNTDAVTTLLEQKTTIIGEAILSLSSDIIYDS